MKTFTKRMDASIASTVRRVKAYIVRNEFEEDVRRTYFALRWGLAAIAIALPLILVGWGSKIQHFQPCQMTSLSAFYWLPMKLEERAADEPSTSCARPLVSDSAPLRDWFVGSLTVLGACLIIYRGYRNKENWLLNIAGVALIVVALCPMPWPPFNQPKVNLHYPAAFLFFAMIAATVFWCARDTLNALPKDTPPEKAKRIQRFWGAIYRSLAFLLVAVPFAVALVATSGWRVIGVEWAGAWVFAAYWILKTIELRRVSQVEPSHGAAPELRWVGGKLLRV